MNCAFGTNSLRVKFYKDKETGDLQANKLPCCYIDRRTTDLETINSPEQLFVGGNITKYRDWFGKNKKTHHPDCLSCKEKELTTGTSPRLQSNLFFRKKDYDIFKLDISVGNECNLSCMYCTPYESSMIEYYSKKYDKVFDNWSEYHDNSTIANTSDYIDSLMESIKDKKIQIFKFIGGEPFTKRNWENIKKIINSIEYKTIFEFTTNGTMLNDNILSELEEIQIKNDIIIKISVDGVYENYNLLRWPSRWGKIENILNNIKLSKISPIVTKLVNVLNYEYLNEFETKMNSIGIPFSYNIHVKPTNSPFNIHFLPNNILSEHELQNNVTPKPIGSETKIKFRDTLLYYADKRNINIYNSIGEKTKEFLEL